MKTLTSCMLPLVVSSALLFATAVASGVFVPVDPRATYLRTESDNALDAVPYQLASLGVSPGDLIRVERCRVLQSFKPRLSGHRSDPRCYLQLKRHTAARRKSESGPGCNRRRNGHFHSEHLVRGLTYGHSTGLCRR